MSAHAGAAGAAALLDAVRALAREAAAVTLRYYGRDIAVEDKGDDDPVTAADRETERVIEDGLKRLAPGIPVVGEEAVSQGRTPDVSGGRFWLVDPLDGTKEFLDRTDDYTVNIALIEGGAPAMGVVVAPPLGLEFAAAGPGTAVMRAGGGDDRRISARPAPADGLVAVVSGRHDDPAQIERFLARHRVREVRRRGSSLKLCEIARGAADIYPRFGPTHEWDIAAGDAVLRAAGGTVTTLDGAAMRYGKPAFRNPGFVARGADEESG